MRTVKNQPAGTPIETDLAKFPDSTVVNETALADGTPVVREIYGDMLTNIYKIVRSTGLVPNGLEDSEANGYQLLAALRKFTNTLNDVEQVLNLTVGTFSIGLDLDILPDKYFCIAKTVEHYDPLVTTYTFKGSGAATYNFTSPTGFASGDDVLLIIDHAGVKGFSLNKTGVAPTAVAEIFTPFGTPLAFNNGSKVWYQSEGVLFSDLPEAYDLQAAIRLLLSDGTILVYEMMIIGDYVLCLSFNPGTLLYRFYKFALSALNTPVAVTGVAFPGADNRPYVYTDGANVFISNTSGSNADDYQLDKYTVNMAAGTLTYSGSVSLDVAFKKTTNAVIKTNVLYTFVAGAIVKFNLGTGVLTNGASFPTFIGNLFMFNGDAYYSNGEVAKKWLLS